VVEVEESTVGLRKLNSSSDDRDLGAHGHGKESLPETSRPGFISTVRPDLFQPTHRLKEEDTIGGILFLRLKDR
jgi:hypothetical protein